MSPSRTRSWLQLGLLVVAAVAALATSYRNPARSAEGKAELPSTLVLIGGPPLLRLVHVQYSTLCGVFPGNLHVTLGLRLGNRSNRPVTVNVRNSHVEVDGRRFDPSEVRFISVTQGGDVKDLTSLEPGRDAVIEVVVKGGLSGRRLGRIDRVAATIATSAGALKLTFKDLVRAATPDQASPIARDRIDELYSVPSSTGKGDDKQATPPPSR